jgi:hypothetical protein
MSRGEDPETAWDNDWDDNESTVEHETQQILHDPVEEQIQDEIRANLSSKITSSLYAYKVAGIALIITLICFTINTVTPMYYLLTQEFAQYVQNSLQWEKPYCMLYIPPDAH